MSFGICSYSQVVWYVIFGSLYSRTNERTIRSFIYFYLFIYLFVCLFVCFFIRSFIYHKIQITIRKQDSYTKVNESGEQVQIETMGLIDIGLPPSKNKVHSNSKARIENKIQ